ncbi:MAG TPA: metallopeptidase TldD-related protein [Gemmatimonadales bacterium]|nr:metallopeptidase TldD-related protein [Gemmatimonadales bacterium]
MIGRILEAAAGRVSAADAAVKSDDTMTLEISADGETRLAGSCTRTGYLRVIAEGRIGSASASDDDAAGLAARAMAAAASGERLELFFPAPAPLPGVVTRSPAAAGAEALDGLARALLDRLARDHRRVEVWAERSEGRVEVANTRGVLAGYEVSLGGIGAVVEPLGPGAGPPCRGHLSAVALPDLPEIEALVAEIERRLAPPVVDWGGSRAAALPVCFAPRALATFLTPLRAALLGREAWLGRSPLRGRLGERLFSEGLSVSDDPLAPGRPGSRPIDDEGVPSRRVTLIERGRLTGFLSDLEVGVRANVPSTGHGWRLPAQTPRAGYTNFLVAPGTESRAALLSAMGTGLLVEDLERGAGPRPLGSGGAVGFRAPWAYLVEGGEVRGRLPGVMLTGNVIQALGRIGGFGSDATWLGSQCLPSLLVEGIGVTVTA